MSNRTPCYICGEEVEYADETRCGSCRTSCKPVHRVYKNGVLYQLNVANDKWEVLALDKPDPDIETVKAHAVEVLANQLALNQVQLGYYSVSKIWPDGLASEDMDNQQRYLYRQQAAALLGYV